MPRLQIALLASTVALALTSPAAHAAPHKAAAGADLPPFEGVWIVQPDYYLGKTLKPEPKLTPVAEEMRRKHMAAMQAGYVRSVGNMLCAPAGGTNLFTIRSPFEIFQGFGRITFIFETEGNNQPRTVYMREKAHPDGLYPSFNGHSIGHWEGKTLVVDTIGFNGRGSSAGGVPKSEQDHTIERFTWSADGKVMSDEITTIDPVYLAAPWTTTIRFNRMAETEERFEVWCEVDLDAFKSIDLQAVKDADPEVARMLDPDTRPTDPALKLAQPKP